MRFYKLKVNGIGLMSIAVLHGLVMFKSSFYYELEIWVLQLTTISYVPTFLKSFVAKVIYYFCKVMNGNAGV